MPSTLTKFAFVAGFTEATLKSRKATVADFVAIYGDPRKSNFQFKKCDVQYGQDTYPALSLSGVRDGGYIRVEYALPQLDSAEIAVTKLCAVLQGTSGTARTLVDLSIAHRENDKLIAEFPVAEGTTVSKGTSLVEYGIPANLLDKIDEIYAGWDTGSRLSVACRIRSNHFSFSIASLGLVKTKERAVLPSKTPSPPSDITAPSSTEARRSKSSQNRSANKLDKIRRKEVAEVKFLRSRARMGYAAPALVDLERFVLGPSSPEAKREALWLTASWRLDHPETDTGSAAYSALKLLNLLSPKRGQTPEYLVMWAEACCRGGMAAEAVAACLAYLEKHDDINVGFALANAIHFARENWINVDNHRLAWINQAFRDVSSITLLDDDKPLGLSNIKAEADPIADGPMVSVIMPCYNASRYLATSAHSILQQSWRNLELIIIDDASTDDSYSIARRIASTDGRVKVARNRTNRGTGYGRSKALSMARGEFVTGQDADDWSHPQKIHSQVQHLLSNPEAVANMSQHARVTNEVVFTRLGRPGFYVAPNLSSFCFRRETFLNSIGYWDSVRFAEDAEYINRASSYFGVDRIIRLDTPPFLFARQHSDGHTSNLETGFWGYKFGARADYAKASEAWHHDSPAEDLHIDFPPTKDRKFVAPWIMTNRKSSSEVDVIIASDFRLPGGSTSSSVEEIKAQRKAGLKTGLVHIPRYDFNPSRELSQKVMSLIDGEHVRMLTYGESCDAKITIFRWPPALLEVPTILPKIRSDNLVIVLNQTPYRHRGDDESSMYSIMDIDEKAANVFGVRGNWAAIGPEAREALDGYEDRVQVADQLWVNTLDVGEWPLRTSRPRNERPVIGRHARDHEDKWPEMRDTLLAAYPEDPAIKVSILGGAETVRKLLGYVPTNWAVHEFDTLHPADYLRGLDVFIYFTHSQWVEAFGRVIFEAMAIGVPVILTPDFEKTFGDAALYAQSHNVRAVVDDLLKNPALYERQVMRGRDFVERGFSHQTHIDRLQEFL